MVEKKISGFAGTDSCSVENDKWCKLQHITAATVTLLGSGQRKHSILFNNGLLSAV